MSIENFLRQFSKKGHESRRLEKDIRLLKEKISREQATVDQLIGFVKEMASEGFRCSISSGGWMDIENATSNIAIYSCMLKEAEEKLQR